MRLDSNDSLVLFQHAAVRPRARGDAAGKARAERMMRQGSQAGASVDGHQAHPALLRQQFRERHGDLRAAQQASVHASVKKSLDSPAMDNTPAPMLTLHRDSAGTVFVSAFDEGRPRQ